MNFETIQLEIKNQIAYLSIARPKALNALNSQVLSELKECLQSLDKNQIRVLIVQGAGDKAFVAGADIKEMLDLKPSEAQQFSKRGQYIFSILEELPFPVIAIVQGFALGGGLELALACDILILSQKAKVGLPEVSLGLLPAFGGTQRLSRTVGLYKAKEMIFTGEFYSAQEALAMGLANKVVAPEELLATAEKIAEVIKTRGPMAVAESKKLIHKSRDLNMEEGLKLEAKKFSDLFHHEESREGMAAFIEKRKPQFKGQK